MIAAAFKCWKIYFVQEALYMYCMSQEVELGPLSKRYREEELSSI